MSEEEKTNPYDFMALLDKDENLSVEFKEQAMALSQIVSKTAMEKLKMIVTVIKFGNKHTLELLGEAYSDDLAVWMERTVDILAIIKEETADIDEEE